MKASSINKSKMFRIRVFNSEHTCPLKDGVHSDCRATSSLIGGIIAPKLRNHERKYIPNDIKDDVKLDLGIDINYMLAWRSKEKALESIMGQPAASYGSYQDTCIRWIRRILVHIYECRKHLMTNFCMFL